MKSSILFLVIVLFSNCKSENHEIDCGVNSLIDTGKVWYISEYPDPCPGCIWPHKIMFGKDTVINSYTYKEILDYQGKLNEAESKATNLGYIRETTDKKVYWYVSLFGHRAVDILMYDFNVQINDTVENYWIVNDIDTVKIMGIERKRIILEDCEAQQIYWIEGVGDMSDLLRYPSRPKCGFYSGMSSVTDGASWYKLNCVEQDSNLIFKNSESRDCWSYIGYRK